IPGTCTQPALHRQPFFDCNGHASAGTKRSHGPFRNAIAGIRGIGRNARIVAANLNARATPHLHANEVVQGDGLVHGAQVVEAVGPQRSNAQTEIDLGEGSDTHGHRDDCKVSIANFRLLLSNPAPRVPSMELFWPVWRSILEFGGI